MFNKNYIRKTPYISKFGMTLSLLFILFTIFARILFPFGDEPDFIVRAPALLHSQYPWWTPYSIFDNLIQQITVLSECKIDASRRSLWGHIDTFTCSESIEQITIRVLITLIVTSPLLFVVTFRKFFINMTFFLPIKLSHVEWNTRLDTLSLALIFPGMIYYLGVFSHEQFTLILSLFIFLFWGSFILVISLVTMILAIDMGNGIVVILFILNAMFFSFLAKKYSPKLSIILMFLLLIFAYFIGFYFLHYFEQISFLSAKAEAMATLAEKGAFIEKYPLILRPIITFMTGIFMPPSGLKVIPLYLLFIFLIGTFMIKLTKKTKKYNKKIILLYVSLTTVVFFVFLFPNYGNAKYYIFLLPFILYSVLIIHSKLNIFKLFIFSNIIVFTNLILYGL